MYCQKRKAESERLPTARGIRSHSGGSYRLLTLSARQQLDQNSVLKNSISSPQGPMQKAMRAGSGGTEPMTMSLGSMVIW